MERIPQLTSASIFTIMHSPLTKMARQFTIPITEIAADIWEDKSGKGMCDG
jgi:hypothetical protein